MDCSEVFTPSTRLNENVFESVSQAVLCIETSVIARLDWINMRISACKPETRVSLPTSSSSASEIDSEVKQDKGWIG